MTGNRIGKYKPFTHSGNAYFTALKKLHSLIVCNNKLNRPSSYIKKKIISFSDFNGVTNPVIDKLCLLSP